MSGIACTVQPAGYPPIHQSPADAVRLVQIKVLQGQAPFGTDPKTKKAITASQYKDAMMKQGNAAKSVHLRWPFWVGLGLAGVGVAVLAVKR